MSEIDPRIIAGIIGAVTALLAAFLSQLLVFYIQQRTKRKDNQMIAFQFALLFLERLKIEGNEFITNDHYYELVSNIYRIPKGLRTELITLYADSKKNKNKDGVFVKRVSELQNKISKKLI